ncbi:MAG TPA: SGNH/GDSL hydrolase family protein [Crocinitomicaceae bacterium]|nr:SGNH/GDSL hydrolase family protein [Crocinitomicaceae bacterium]
MIKKWIYYILLTPICFEVALLVLGYRKYTPIDYTITSSPSYCLSPDAKLGFALNPGSFEVTMNKGLIYSVTHSSDSLREIPFPHSDSAENKIYFLGCSYTYGMGVNDDENLPALVQKEVPNSVVKNFGVPGFGTIQSYLQLQKMITENDIPTTVILNYANFHDIRNALTPFYRENLKIGFERSNKEVKKIMQSGKIPFVKEQNGHFSIEFCEWNNLYKHWPLRSYLASVNYLQSQYDLRKDNKIQKKKSLSSL